MVAESVPLAAVQYEQRPCEYSARVGPVNVRREVSQIHFATTEIVQSSLLLYCPLKKKKFSLLSPFAAASRPSLELQVPLLLISGTFREYVHSLPRGVRRSSEIQ
jgi:hypothetical protein